MKKYIVFSAVFVVSIFLFGCKSVCTDTDGGLNFEFQGTARSIGPGRTTFYEDRCLYLQETGPQQWAYQRVDECFGPNCNLQEGYCEGNEVTNIAHYCNATQVCKNGACVINCTETDGGADYDNAGTTTIWSGQFSDYCTDWVTLTEFFCNSSFQRISHTCPCVCSDGRCTTCFDSDGGVDYAEQGTVSTCNPREWHYDTCNGQVLTEYSCQDGVAAQAEHTCDDLCERGACVALSGGCTETDAGLDFYHKGTVSVGGRNYYDVCQIQGSGLTEFYCLNDRLESAEYTCPNYCLDNHCVDMLTCTDSDGGINYATPGQCRTFYDGQPGPATSDFCTGGVINECYCEENHIEFSLLRCPGSCSNGRCR